MALTRRFTPLTLLMISINGMVGSAWLFAPLYAARLAGSAAIIAWIIGGVATALVALTFAELSVMFPVAGGTAHIPKLSHGNFTSFIVSWIAWLSALAMAPIEVLAILQYASTYFTSLTISTDGTPILTSIGMVWATVLMFAFCVLNALSYRGLMRSNFLLFWFKVAVIIIAVVFMLRSSFHPGNFAGMTHYTFTKDGWHGILAAVASGGIAFAFTGFKHGVELAGEAKNAAVAIPLAIIGSVLGCLLLYIGLQVAFIGALHPSLLADGWEKVSFTGDVGPFAGLAASLGLIWLVKLLYVDAIISPSGAGLIYVTSTARILYAMSKMGYVPRWIAYLNQQHFPVAAIMVNFVLGMFLFLPLPGWQAMVSFLVSGMVISYAMGPIALLCMRLELPQQKRKFRLPAAYFTCLLAFYFCNLLSYWTGWDTISKLAIAMLIGVCFFIFACLRGRLSLNEMHLKTGCWIIPYLAGLILISYLGAFGGKEMIPFGWDFAVIAIFSVVILVIAVKNRLVYTSEELIAAMQTAEATSV